MSFGGRDAEMSQKSLNSPQRPTPSSDHSFHLQKQHFVLAVWATQHNTTHTPHTHTQGMLSATMLTICKTWAIAVFNCSQTQPTSRVPSSAGRLQMAGVGECVCVCSYTPTHHLPPHTHSSLLFPTSRQRYKKMSGLFLTQMSQRRSWRLRNTIGQLDELAQMWLCLQKLTRLLGVWGITGITVLKPFGWSSWLPQKKDVVQSKWC